MATFNEKFDRQLSNTVIDELSTAATVLPWDHFQNWVYCICVVKFDLELGQAMELVYPAHAKLTEKEKTSICYLSFPDSNSGCMGDTQFHFRIRQCTARHFPLSRTVDYNRNCPAALQTDNGYYYGFVHFRQTKDKTVKRGYFQKSLVLISKLPLYNLFTYLIGVIAPEYFDNGEPCLEAACHDIDQWPSPTPGETLNLPIMGTVVQVRIPSRSDKVHGVSTPKIEDKPLLPANNILASVHEVDLFSVFHPILPHIQMLWELVLIGEPIIVMAALPATCANTVQALVSMIEPLKYCTDYRPYFTIHDSEFKEYTTKTQSPPTVILGVTNPFFAKTLQHWPHIVRIGEMSTAASQKSFNKLKKGGSLKTLDSKPGLYTRYKPFLNKDTAVLKKLVKGIQSKRPGEIQSAILRRHLLELTQSFMIPLERYVGSLMPFHREIAPHKGAPQLRPFELDGFLKMVETTGPQLTSGLKGDWIGLYRRFFQSANFEGWWQYRQTEINQKLQALHMEALSETDLLGWVQDKQEVEIVDLILRLREKLRSAHSSQIPISDDVIHKLQFHHDAVIASLPEDLQSVLKSN